MRHPELETPPGRHRRPMWSWRHPWPALARGLTVALGVALALGCESTPSEPEGEPTLSLALGLTSVMVEQGESGGLTGTATVGGSFVGSPTVTLLGVPAGVSGTVGTSTTSGNTTTISLTIAVGASVIPGTYTLTVRATGSGVSDEATLTLIVTAAALYTLQIIPPMLAVEQGSSGTAAVTLARTNFTGEVSLTAENAPSGMAVSFDPSTTTGDASDVTVTVDGSMADATYDLTIRGEAPGLEDRTEALQVKVEAAAEEAYSLSVTPSQLTLDPAQPASADAESGGPARVSTGQVTVQITRINGHSEPISLDLIHQPEGVTATFEPESVSASVSTLTVAVGASVVPGEYVMSVRGQDGVLPERTTQLLLLVNPTPTYQLLPDPSALSIQQGTSGNAEITVSRANFTEDVTLSLEGAPAGMTGSFAPNPATAKASTLTLEVGESVTTGDYDVTIRGTTAELADRTAAITVSVSAQESFSLDPIPAITVQQGASESRAVTITRTGGFAGEVTLGVAPAVAGLTMALEPTSTVGSQAALTATASATVAPGTYAFDVTGSADVEPSASTTVDVTVTPATTTVTVHPATIDDVLYNPGMGFSDWFFGYGYQYPQETWVSFGDYQNPPPYPDDYPPSTEAYFRWCWNQIEPVEGQIDFDRIDTIIQNAAVRSEGERLGFRIMTISDPIDCMPDWLLSKPGYVGYDGFGRHVPDYSNPVFLEAVEHLYGALGARYDGEPGMDHIDLGIVGCWGEWNTACLAGDQDLCQIMGQSEDVCTATFEHVIDIMMDAFPNTPKIGLGGFMDHALERGAGWRVDCFGDWGMFSPTWSHHTDVYPQMLSRPGVSEAWRRGPIHLEICWTFPHWYYEFGMSVDLVQQTFDWALDNHASVINGKSTPIPAAYWPIVQDFLKKAGYRLVIDAVTHPGTAAAGETVPVETIWKNLGVAPPYLPHQVAFRLRDSADGVVTQELSGADILGWLPGTYTQDDTITLPGNLVPGAYSVDVAILAPDGSGPAIDLAIEGRQPDGWYELSVIHVE